MQPWRPRSLKAGLIAMVAICVLPPVLVAALLVWRQHEMRRDELYQGTVLLARAAAASLDRELAGIEAGLQVLSSSRSLTALDVPSFHRRARDALGHGIVAGYRLSDAGGRLLLDSERELDASLAELRVARELDAVTREGRTVVTDAYRDPGDPRWKFAMGVPVRRDDEVPYCLHVVLASERIATILQRPPLPPGWIAVMIDTGGTIVARSPRPEAFVGSRPVQALLDAAAAQPEGRLETTTRDGLRVLSAFSRSSLSGWTVAVGAPSAVLGADLRRSAAFTVLGVVVAFGLGIGFALMLGRHLGLSVASLIEPARRLGSGRPTEVPTQRLAELEAVAVALREANDRLASAQHSALHDSLTGLPNRAFLEQIAPGALAAGARRGATTAVLALDLDGFKQVNDRLGHAAGDAVLREAAGRLTKTLRVGDSAARIGGDEFVVLLPDTDLGGARRVGEKLIAALSAPYAEVDLPVATSIGIATTLYFGEESWPALLGRADAALYAAKRAGKGRVEIARSA